MELRKLRKLTQEELKEILELHKLWVESREKEGKRADLSYTDLSNVDLSNVDLSNAYLRNAYLKYCNLSYTILVNTDLTNADLRFANLSNAYLSNANLSCADLRYADLYKTDLFYAKVDNMISIGNVGNENRTVYYFYKEDRVICGCFDDTLEKFKEAVKEKYGEDYGSYKKCITLFEMYE